MGGNVQDYLSPGGAVGGPALPNNGQADGLWDAVGGDPVAFEQALGQMGFGLGFEGWQGMPTNGDHTNPLPNPGYVAPTEERTRDPFTPPTETSGGRGQTPTPIAPTQPTPIVPPGPTQPPVDVAPPAPGSGGTPTPPNPGPGEGLGGTQGPNYRDPFEYNYNEQAPPDRGTVDWLDLTFSGGPLYGTEGEKPALGGEYLYPGEFSPWGSNEFPGNNSDFYAKQFQRMLENNLRWQDQNAATNPPGSEGYEAPKPPDYYAPKDGAIFQYENTKDYTKQDWVDIINRNPEAWREALTGTTDSPVFTPERTEGWTQEDWAEAILKNPEAWREALTPKTEEGGTPLPAGPGGEGYQLNPHFNISSGMTNQEVVAALSSVFDKDDLAYFNKKFKQSPETASGTNWASASGPEQFLANLLQGDNTGANLERMQKLFNNIYLQA